MCGDTKRVVVVGLEFLEPGSAPLFADGRFACELRSWRELAADKLRPQAGQVLIVALPNDEETAADLLRSGTQPALGAPVLAILRSDSPASLLWMVWRAADDFVTAPVRSEELEARLERLSGKTRQDSELPFERLLREAGMAQLVGSDPAFHNAISKLPLIARSASPVLITGETGTGKEMCARAVHLLGPRRTFPFVAVDCGALPDNLIENELFGHVRGAYTDARQDQRGLIALAEKGTLFLDEVDALSPAAQAKLLRFLQERIYKPLGAERFVKSDINIITATNRDLNSCVSSGRFRADLYFRLNVLRVHLPPLRERLGDIEPLTRHFLQMLADGGKAKVISASGLRKLAAYHWPGNVRELYNSVQRAVALTEGPVILPHDLPTGDAAEPAATESLREGKTSAAEAFERSYVESMLRKHLGNVTHAAREAGKDRRAFGRLVKKYKVAKH